MATFTDDPLPSETLAVSQPKIRDNNQFFKDYVGKDHNFVATSNTALNNPFGYHTVIHQVTQGGDPATIAGVNQIYAKTATIPGDTQLFTRTGGGGISQLTGSKGAINGYVWCAGILLQWGIVAPTNALTVPVSFVTSNVNFPNNIFNVQVTRQRPTADPGSTYEFYVDNTTVSTTGFSVINRDGHSYGFYWYAIGN